MGQINGKQVKQPRPMAAPDIDVDLLESFVEEWDSTIRRTHILGKDVAVDPRMQNLIDAGREYARLYREGDDESDDSPSTLTPITPTAR